MAWRLHIAVACLFAPVALGGLPEDDLAPLPSLKPKPRPKPATVAPAPPARAPSSRRSPRGTDESALLAPLVPASQTALSVPALVGVSGAVVSIDGRAIGSPPLSHSVVTGGEHVVTVARPGFATFTRRVTAQLGKTVEVVARLVPVSAVLTVACRVPGAEVRLDGHLAGKTPLAELEVPPGSVELTVAKRGFEVHRQRLELEAGVDYPLTVELVVEPPVDRPVASTLVPSGVTGDTPLAVREALRPSPPPLTRTWYFWTGVGVVAAGVVTGVVMGVTAALPPLRHSPQELQCPGCQVGALH